MRLFIVSMIFGLSAAAASFPLSEASGDSRVNQLSWPAFAELNHTYAAKAVPEDHGFRLEYRLAGKKIVKQVAVPAELWDRMKGDFRPRDADAVVAANGELSSVEVKENGRELWITFERSPTTGRCLAMVYPSGRGIGGLSPAPTSECGS